VRKPVDTTAGVDADAFGACLDVPLAADEVDVVIAVGVPAAVSDHRSGRLWQSIELLLPQSRRNRGTWAGRTDAGSHPTQRTGLHYFVMHHFDLHTQIAHRGSKMN
jgi:hypothetical protein